MNTVKLKLKKFADVLKENPGWDTYFTKIIANLFSKFESKVDKRSYVYVKLNCFGQLVSASCISPLIGTLLLESLIDESSYPLLIDYLLQEELKGPQEATCYKCKEKGGVRYRKDAYSDHSVVLDKKGNAKLVYESVANMDFLQSIECFTCGEELNEDEFLGFNKIGNVL